MSNVVDAINQVNALCASVGVQPPVGTGFEAALAQALGGPAADPAAATGAFPSAALAATPGTATIPGLASALADLGLTGTAATSPGSAPGVVLLAPVSGPVTSGWGPRINPVTHQPEFHEGIDLAASEGTPVQAAASGTVTYAGWMSGYGNVVFVDSPGGMQTRYGHESSLSVAVGQQVTPGQTLGAVGSTGISTGPHVYFQVLRSGTPVDPSPYLGLPSSDPGAPAPAPAASA